MIEIKPNLPAPAAVNNPCRSGSDSAVAGDTNPRPTKKIKVESPPPLPLPIPAIPLAAFPHVPCANLRLSSPVMVRPPTVAQAPRAPPLLPPKIPALFNAAQPPPAPKINAVAQKIPAVDRVAPPKEKPVGTATAPDSHKQFWKAGDYDGAPSAGGNWESYASCSDHIRVHPRFLHSNATSHRWVLGAFAELMDNSLDEIRNGATFVNIDMIENKKKGDRMLVIEDNGGGMDPIRMRQCMSLGYSAKSKMANTIGQYGNGFKTSTMRLGADVLVFSRFRGKDGNRSTQSIGLLSYTFLRCTKKEDIEVPMLDYGRKGQVWERIVRPTTSSGADWNKKVDTIVQWSPFSSETELLEQFNGMKEQGTRIFIYNLWEDEQGELELDFDADPYDIQIRGVNRDAKNIQMAQQFPNSRHFLSYRHSLRSYASILYLRIPKEFRMILRGREIEHHNVVNDMMMIQKVTYRPQQCPDVAAAARDSKMVADVTVGFVKDAKSHIDVQGFNVYHKNRLIKPFWRVWHPPGSDGRGVIGVLEANFIEPAHDKQGFERTLVLSRLETKLAQMQKTYWSSRCHEIGYAPRKAKKSNNETERDNNSDRCSSELNVSVSKPVDQIQNGRIENPNLQSRVNANNGSNALSHIEKDQKPSSKQEKSSETVPPSSAQKSRTDDCRQSNVMVENNKGNVHSHTPLFSKILLGKSSIQATRSFPTNAGSKRDEIGGGSSHSIEELTKENRERLRLKMKEFLGNLLRNLEEEKNKCKSMENELDREKNRCKSMETQLQEAVREIQELNKEQNSLIDLFGDERKRHEREEEQLRTELKDALKGGGPGGIDKKERQQK